jgi:NAD(P)H-dependent FMN reductase
MDQTINVAVICGSPREVSYTRGLGRCIVGALEAQGAAVELLDLRHHALPPLDPRLRREREAHPDPAVGRLFSMASAADGFVLASPVYHNSYSGVLKNALDYLRIPDLRYKPLGLASHGGGSSQAVDHLRQVVRGLNGVGIPTQVCTREADFADLAPPADHYTLTDPDILARVERFADELIRFAVARRPLRAAETAGG